jgi:hypothetical protein
MTWQENLFNNLLTVFVLLSIAIIAYCKVKKITFIEFIKSFQELKEDE